MSAERKNNIACAIGEFLTDEARERLFTGILFSEGRTPLYLHFRQGQLINIESWDPVYSLAAFALSTGLINSEEYGRIRTAQLDSGDRLIDLLKTESRADHSTILRLYETFAYVTLLHLIRENGEYSAIEGAVAADPTLIEAINPERFTDRLATLVDDGKATRISRLWDRHLIVNDPACGLENGPVATGFLHASKRFLDHLSILEKALTAQSVSDIPAPWQNTENLARVIPVLLFGILAMVMLLWHSVQPMQAPQAMVAAEQQLDFLRDRLGDAVQEINQRMGTR